MKTILVATLLAVSFSTIEAQDKQAARHFVKAPAENTFLTVAAQPESALMIEDAQLLLSLDHSWNFKFRFRLKNRGDKTIRNAQLHFWTSDGSGGTLTTPFQNCGPLSPGATVGACAEDADMVVVPLTAEIRKKLKLGLPMKQVVILLVESVEFSDGSVYSDKGTLQALKDYFDSR